MKNGDDNDDDDNDDDSNDDDNNSNNDVHALYILTCTVYQLHADEFVIFFSQIYLRPVDLIIIINVVIVVATDCCHKVWGPPVHPTGLPSDGLSSVPLLHHSLSLQTAQVRWWLWFTYIDDDDDDDGLLRCMQALLLLLTVVMIKNDD